MKSRIIPLFLLAHFCSGFQSTNQTSKTETNKNLATAVASKNDEIILRELNARFIKNFISMDTNAHNEIIHKDFISIGGSGRITNRKEYMEYWSTGYKMAGYTSFTYSDERIRVFGNMALVRAKTIATNVVDGTTKSWNTIYTDTYIKENGRWWCVQAQITPQK